LSGFQFATPFVTTCSPPLPSDSLPNHSQKHSTTHPPHDTVPSFSSSNSPSHLYLPPLICYVKYPLNVLPISLKMQFFNSHFGNNRDPTLGMCHHMFDPNIFYFVEKYHCHFLTSTPFMPSHTQTDHNNLSLKAPSYSYIITFHIFLAFCNVTATE
jgi:hypothetical protein